MFVDLEKIELLDGLLCFNPYFMVLAVIVLGHFFYSWYKSYIETGWKLDVWHLTLFPSFILSCVIMYPFASSEMNFFATGTGYIQFSPYVEEAFFISLVGYFSMLLGKAYYIRRSHKFGRFNFLSNIVLTNICHSTVLYLWSLMCILFFVVSFYLSLREGMLFNGRGWFLTHPSYRFVGNFVTGIYVLCFSYIGMRLLSGMGRREDKYLLLGLFLSSIAWGSRSETFGPIFFLFSCWCYLNPTVSLKKILGVGVLIFVGVILLGVLRGQNGVQEDFLDAIALVGSNIFYGNSFSDVRDFAWMLSGFDGVYQMGITYISGFSSFLPSDIFPWRREYAMGVYTLELAGIPNITGEHPGLRGGPFFEMFFNFSYIGVIISGFVLGYLLERTDRGMRYYVEYERNVIKGYLVSLPYILFSTATITAGMFKIYVLIGFHLVSIFVEAFLHHKNKGRIL